MVGKSVRMGKNAASKDIILGMQEKKAREKMIPCFAIWS
jgi:hypothetical protein